jgi:hypothetical protein
MLLRQLEVEIANGKNHGTTPSGLQPSRTQSQRTHTKLGGS